MGTYKNKKDLENAKSTPLQIRAQKCQTSKARNAERKRERIERDREMYAPWRSLTPEQQLTRLEKENPNGANKQKAKIRQKIKKKKCDN